MQKLLIFFFSKNISIYAIFNDQSFNDTLKDIISFEQLGPVVFKTMARTFEIKYSLQNISFHKNKPFWKGPIFFKSQDFRLFFLHSNYEDMQGSSLIKQLIHSKGSFAEQHYHNNPKYWDRQAWANSVNPDQMLQNRASDQDLYCLPLIQLILDISPGSQIWLTFKSMVRSYGAPILRVINMVHLFSGDLLRMVILG